MADFNKLSGQTGAGKTISIPLGGAQNVHVVPTGIKHEITILCNAIAFEEITVKIDGEATGIIEAVDAKKTRVIWVGTIVGGAGTNTINCESNGTTARVWGKFRTL